MESQPPICEFLRIRLRKPFQVFEEGWNAAFQFFCSPDDIKPMETFGKPPQGSGGGSNHFHCLLPLLDVDSPKAGVTEV